MVSTDSAQYQRIAIWGDDELVVRALVGELRARQTDAQIALLARDPQTAAPHPGLEVWSADMDTPRAALRAGRRLSSCDLLVVAGSRALAESLPNLCRWTALARLVPAVGARLAVAQPGGHRDGEWELLVYVGFCLQVLCDE